jgi:hypothetical protein
MSEMSPEELERKKKQLSALLSQVSAGQPQQTEAEQDISNMDRWGQQSPELLQNLGNPNFQPTPCDRALAASWAKQDPELFNSLLPDAQEPESLPVIASSPWLEPVIFAGAGILVLLIL